MKFSFRKFNNDCSRVMPTVLTILNAIGVIGTAVLASKETIKAVDILKEKEAEKGEPLSNLEKAKAVGKTYIPAITVGAATIAAGVGSNILSNKQKAALAGAAVTLDRMYKEYKESVKDIYGEDADKKVETEIARKKEYFRPSGDKELFYDQYWGDYFEATNEEILSSWLAINEELQKEGYISLARVHELYGLEPKKGEELFGWSIDTFCQSWEGNCWIHFEIEKIQIDDGLFANVIYALEPPERDFDREWR